MTGNITLGGLSPGIYRSTNNGDSWQRSTSVLPVEGYYGFYFTPNANFAVSRDTPVLLRSTDTGLTWTVVPGIAGFIYSIVYFKGMLFGCTDSGAVSSTDDGLTWQRTSVTNPLPPIYVMTGGSSLLVGTSSGLYRSEDSGSAWHTSQAGLTAQYIGALVNSGIALIAGTERGIYKSTDKGASWGPVTGPFSNDQIQAIAVTQLLWFVQTLTALYRSSDQGTTWSKCAVTGSPIITPRGILASSNKTLYRSRNGGVAWDSVGQFFSSTGPILMAGYQSILARWSNQDGLLVSTDFGDSWTYQNPPDLSPTAISICHGNILMGGSAGVYLSTDTGLTWHLESNQGRVRSISSDGDYSVSLADTNYFLSTDAGATWKHVSGDLPNLRSGPVSLTMTDLYLGINNNQIYHASLLPETVSESKALMKGILRVNPNPAPGAVHVDYSLKYSSKTLLTIFDPLGRTVALPVAGETQEAGEHMITVDARSLSPGVYTARLVAGGQVSMVKFVVER